MKLYLLLVLAVVALVPSISESRIVSKCELRKNLGKVITLEKKFVPYKDQILAVVICEMERKSHFNTGLTTVYGDRKPTTTATPSALTTAGNNMTIIDATTTSTTTLTTTSPSTANPIVETTTTTMINLTTTSPSTANPIVETTTTSMINLTTTTSPTTANTSINSGSASNITANGARKKRDAPRKSNKSNSEKSLADLVNDEDDNSDEEEMMQDEEHSPDDKPTMGKWSLGYYGIFQLSDSHFCNSGYRWSRNVCRSSCSAFTNDDITDDVACFVSTGYWRQLLRTASQQCQRGMKTYFAECAA